MKYHLIFLSLFVFAQPISSQTLNPDYDSTLAIKYGADDYGMKNYVLAILKAGSNTTTDKAFIDSCFSGHMANILRLVNEGKLIVAGPFGKNDKSYRGIFIFEVSTIQEARKLVETDPAVNSGLLDLDLYNWYGSAALPAYIDLSKKIGRYNIN